MKRLLITEGEKKRILGLYGILNEQETSPLTSIPNKDGIYYVNYIKTNNTTQSLDEKEIKFSGKFLYYQEIRGSYEEAKTRAIEYLLKSNKGVSFSPTDINFFTKKLDESVKVIAYINKENTTNSSEIGVNNYDKTWNSIVSEILKNYANTLKTFKITLFDNGYSIINGELYVQNKSFTTPSGKFPFLGIYDKKNDKIEDITIFLETNLNDNNKQQLISKLDSIGYETNEKHNVRINNEFKEKLYRLLEEAKNWWRKWLNNPNIRIKFKKLNGYILDTEVDEIYTQYFNLLDKLTLEFVNVTPKMGGTVLAWVQSDKIEVIFINNKTGITDDRRWLTTLTHEIQHSLYLIKPLTPNKSITKFRNDDGCYKKNREIYNNQNIENKDFLLNLKLNKNKINKISKDIGLDVNKTTNFIKEILQTVYNGFKEEYFFEDDSELASRVIGTKEILLMNTNRIDLTKQDFTNLFKKTTNFDGIDEEIQYVLGYWATRGFEPLENFVNLLNNSFVKVDKKTQGIETMS
jgi:hypothetical protein